MDKISNQLELYNGIKIPAMGFGVWQIAPIHTSKCVKMAIGTGYRNIDTAEGYMNEKGVGKGVRQANGIVVEVWSPLGSGGVLKNGELNRIAKKYNKSAAQICIRWLLQKNIVPFPKSTHEKYIMENADVFDFALSEEDMASIDRIPYCGGMMFDPDSARS